MKNEIVNTITQAEEKETKETREHLLGRLLAIYDEVELEAYNGNPRGNKTQAIRFLKQFYMRTCETVLHLDNEMYVAWVPRLGREARERYEKMLCDIVGKIYKTESKLGKINKPEDVMFGFHAQKAEFQDMEYRR